MKKDYTEGMSVKNKYEEWVPAIPLPFYRARRLFFWWYQCTTCGEKPMAFFKTEEQYEGHYVLNHILGLPYTGPKAF